MDGLRDKQEKLEHEINVLEEARNICYQYKYSFPLGLMEDKLKEDLEALKKPKFRDGTLGIWEDDLKGVSAIYAYMKDHNHDGFTFQPLPIETILRHLAQYMEGATGWEYYSKNTICFRFDNPQNEKVYGLAYQIPAPNREDWQNVKGEL